MVCGIAVVYCVFSWLISLHRVWSPGGFNFGYYEPALNLETLVGD